MSLGRQWRAEDIRAVERVPIDRLREIVREYHGKTLQECIFSFLERMDVVRAPDYMPTEQDILRCRVMTTGIFETRFEVDKVRFQ